MIDPASLHGVGAPHLQAGYGVSLNDVAAFEQSVAKAGASAAGSTVHAPSVGAPGQAMQALFRPLEHLNGEASGLSGLAQTALNEGRPLSPGEMVALTVKCHEFMFHCQLTANVANRTSDGLQQLFRQQA